jgi:hypothetical protein
MATATNTTTDEIYNIEFSAKVGLYNYMNELEKRVTYPPSYFRKMVNPETYGAIIAKIRKMNLPVDILEVSFEIIESQTCYNGNNVYMMARFNGPKNKYKILQEMESYISSFNESAVDGYLEGDAVVYSEPKSQQDKKEDENENGDSNEYEENYNKIYELVLDDIKIAVYDENMSKKICSLKSGKHWF